MSKIPDNFSVKPSFISPPSSQWRKAQPEGKSQGVASEFFGFREIARGAEKVVSLKELLKPQVLAYHRENRAFYTPVESFFKSRERALKSELSKMKQISGSKEISKKNLNLEAEILEGEQRINGQFTVAVKAAKGDFEKEITKKETTFDQRVQFGRDFISGLTELHKAGYAYGDLKPENCLIFEDQNGRHLKIADFGKTEKVGEGEKLYKGNPRFASPEGVLSKKSDVFGAALVLIRNLEETVLDEEGNPLLENDQKESDDIKEGRRGVEKFILQHKAFPATDGIGWKGKIKLIFQRLRSTMLSQNEKAAQEKAVHQYIDELGSKLIAHRINHQGEENHDEIEKICSLLKKMTRADPEQRPNLEKVLNEYQEIFPDKTLNR